jgi:hypothetical protein
VSCLGCEAESLKNGVTVRPVAEVDILEGDRSCLRPVCRCFNFFRSFALNGNRSAFRIITFFFAYNSQLLWNISKPQQLLDSEQVVRDISASMKQRAEAIAHALELREQ